MALGLWGWRSVQPPQAQVLTQTLAPSLRPCPRQEPVCQVVVRSLQGSEPALHQIQSLLAARQWDAADQATEQWLAATGGVFQLPCTDLRSLDTLWATASHQRHGLRAQNRLWASQGRRGNFPDRARPSDPNSPPPGYYPTATQALFSNTATVWFSRHEQPGAEYLRSERDPTSTADWCCYHPPAYRLDLCQLR